MSSFRSGPVKPMARRTRSAANSCSVPSIGSNDIRPSANTCSTRWVRRALTRPSRPTNSEVLMAYSRSPPSS